MPLIIRQQQLRIKDSQSTTGYRNQTITIRETRRGPLISDHGIDLADNLALSLRWASKEPGALSASLGTDTLLLAKNIDEARAALKTTPTPLSYVVVDKHGDIARISTGHVPNRIRGDGSKPFVVRDGIDNWDGLIPAAAMPAEVRPESGWVGTANHRVVDANYPYEYSTFFSSSWRYRRIQEFMTEHQTVSLDDHWSLINDVKNPMAEKLRPIISTALAADQQTLYLADILNQWNLRDERDQNGAAVFQVLMKHFVQLTFNDDISGQTWDLFFDTDYYWQERLLLLMQDNNNHWFDQRSTSQIETRDQLLRIAALAAAAELRARLGSDPDNWLWGDVLNITFSSPVIPGKTAAKWLGAGTQRMFGSSETLNRGKYKYSSDYEAQAIDSTRFVADMSDKEKVVAVIPGGSSGRYLDDTLANQNEAWMNGDKHYWWYSDEKINQHTVHSLQLIP